TLSGIGMGALVFGESIRPVLLISLAVLFLGLAISNGQVKRPTQLWGQLLTLAARWIPGIRGHPGAR
ncbi:MAG: hypothetical protein ACJAZ1_003632, partial [Yoonia sp.]